jgi:hypothetical protein
LFRPQNKNKVFDKGINEIFYPTTTSNVLEKVDTLTHDNFRPLVNKNIVTPFITKLRPFIDITTKPTTVRTLFKSMTETTKDSLKDLYNKTPIKDIFNQAPLKDIYTDYVTDVPKPIDEVTKVFTPFKNIYDHGTNVPKDLDNFIRDFEVRDYFFIIG